MTSTKTILTIAGCALILAGGISVGLRVQARIHQHPHETDMAQFTADNTLNRDRRFADNVENAEVRLQALETIQSGASWPAVPRGGMLAINTTLGLVGQRDLANTKWIPQWRIGGSPDHVLIGGSPVSSSLNVDLTDADGRNYLLCDASGGDITITLPAGVDNPHQRVVVLKADDSDNTVTVTGTGVLPGDHVLTTPGDAVAMIAATTSAWYPERRVIGNVVYPSGTGSPYAYAAGAGERFLFVDLTTGGSSMEITLPDPSGHYVEAVHTVKLLDDNAGAYALTVKPHSGGNIDGLATDTAYTFPAVASSIGPARTFMRVGATQWYIVEGP